MNIYNQEHLLIYDWFIEHLLLCVLEGSRRFRSRATEFPHDCTIMSQYCLKPVETGFVLGLLRSERTVAVISL